MVCKPERTPQGDAPESASGICYYEKAGRLEAVAEELLADPRAEQDSSIVDTVASLLSLIADIKEDNPLCWETGGRCPKCRRGRGRSDEPEARGARDGR